MKKEKILVVDDEKLVFEAIEEIIGDDYQLIYAENGVEGLKLYTEHQPMLIMLDLRMPIMDGFEFLKQMGVSSEDSHSIIVLSGHAVGEDVGLCFDMGITSFLRKPFNIFELKGVVKHSILAQKNRLALQHYSDHLESLVLNRTLQLSEKVEALEQTKTALRDAMGNLLVTQVTPGVFWVQIPEAGLYILCGCPEEVVKHLMRQGFIKTIKKEGVTFETGPNVILLSDLLVQNGGFANLSEFPILQMLYRQGMILPGHPNNTGIKPMLMGSSEQVRAQMEYIHRGKHGLVSKEEMLACGVDETSAENMMKVKLKFAFGSIQSPSQLLDTLVVDQKPQLIRNGVEVQRIDFNHYRFSFRGRSADVDLNLSANDHYQSPYLLGHHRFRREYFAVLNSGEGDGWDINRPTMGSVIMYQGRIFLVDAGPGIFHALTALGIDISEVEGVFHTHGHDDHFAGLPALIHSGHRLKYFATPPVRAAVAKKFTALMSLDEEKFGQFFNICDLSLDTWNDCDGLDVMPFYSAHPTETNLFLFRALDGNGYKSYAHWADLSSFKVMDDMVGEGVHDVPASFIEKIKRDYKTRASLKKLDIGGGQIHGVAEDFRNDPSGRIILSHIDRKLTDEEMEIGSNSSFGALDVLIQGDQDYLYQRAFRCMKTFFPEVDVDQIRILLNSPVVEYNAGTIICRSGEMPNHVEMILSGTVVYLESKLAVRNHLSFGSLVGENILFGIPDVLEGTYRAFSHCSVIRFPVELFRTFLTNNGILNQMKVLLDKIWFLRKTWLFSEQTTFASLGTIARSMQQISYPSDTDIKVDSNPKLWFVVEGSVQMSTEKGGTLDPIKVGGFFGEHTYFPNSDLSCRFKTRTNTKLYTLHLEKLLEIPIVHWKMLEIYEKRQKRLSS